MHRRPISLLLIFCAVVVTYRSVQAQEQYTLRYKFEKGTTYRFADTTTAKTSQEMMGQEVKATSNILSITKLVTDETREDGTSILTLSSEAMTVKVKSPQADTTLLLKDMIGKRTRVTVSKLGAFTNREIIDTVKLTGMMGGMAQRGMFNFHTYPEKPVKIGEKWTLTQPDTNESMGNKVVTTSTIEYTLVARETRSGRESLKLSYAGKIVVAGKGMVMGSNFFLEGSGTLSGILFVDPLNGLPFSDESKRDMESTVAITGQQNMTIPSSQSITAHRILVTE